MGDGETDVDLELRPSGESLTGGESDELLPSAWKKYLLNN